MKKLLHRFLASGFSLVLVAATVMLASYAEANAQCPVTTVTGDLQSPLGITQSNQGNLLVSETSDPAPMAGATPVPNTGRVSIVGLDGTRRTLLAGLPSGTNAIGDASGPSGLFMRGRTLYVVIGEGDSTISGPIPGATELPNPNPSSSLFSSVLAIQLSAGVEKSTNGFTLTSANQLSLASGQKVTLTNGGGDRITVELIANFPDFTPSPLPFFPPNVRHSNPFDLVVVGDQAYVTDGGQNSVWKADIPSGTFSTLASFPPIMNPLPFGPPVVEAVPTGISYSNEQLLVTLFRGFPFPQGESDVVQVDPLSGNVAQFIGGLSSAIDVLAISSNDDTDHLVLEFSADMLGGQPGRLLRFETPADPPTVIASCLITPTSMTLDDKTGTLYVTELGTGRVVAIPIAP